MPAFSQYSLALRGLYEDNLLRFEFQIFFSFSANTSEIFR